MSSSSQEDADADLIRDVALRRGEGFVRASLAIREPENVLTIVANAGVHPVPDEYVFGELYEASRGNLDFSSIESVNREYDSIILNLHSKLVSRIWNKIYLFPFGHSTLSMNIKLAVYRTLRMETIDIFYFGSGNYGLLEREMRKNLTGPPLG